MQTLNDKISALLNDQPVRQEVPGVILNNLKKDYGRRPYQLEAFERFILYMNDRDLRTRPVQLLFHMATGSGKTLIMAGCILYLYQKGYRNFIFFVNSTNIIDKTRDNFLNPNASKYLFSNHIIVDEKRVQIKEVENFQTANVEDINIVFSTIQGLHSRFNTPKENAITYNDFADKRIVLISDEAHHINAETKKGQKVSREESEEVLSWEGTVNRVFNANKENILLEFTATADLSNSETGKKYKGKLLFDYSLKQFRADGYSKEVKVLQSDMPLIERAIQAAILSQYRRKVFIKYKMLIKPVVLFKSRSIKECEVFQEEFLNTVRNLKPSFIEKIQKNAGSVLQKAFAFFDAQRITTENLTTELKHDFSEEKCISVNSKDESEAKQIAVNTLEDASNEYRVVFAVDKLNEGWDVLNLFDIVRLYDTRDASNGKPGKTTMSEAQLIGRGARYCPFITEDGQSPFMRKFDLDIGHELRVCEELYYHSAYNPRYIDELNSALVGIGIKEKATVEIEVKLKESFKKTQFYKSGLVYLNQLQQHDNSAVKGLPETLINFAFKVSLATSRSVMSDAFNGIQESGIPATSRIFLLSNLGIPVIRKAMDRLEFYRFSNLKKYLPNLTSSIEFIQSSDYLGKVKVKVEGGSSSLSQDEKLEIAASVLRTVSERIISEKIEIRGSLDYTAFPIREKLKDKKLNLAVGTGDGKESGIAQSATTNRDVKIDLANKEWFVFDDPIGTDTEKLFARHFDDIYQGLQSKCSEVYLIRNEKYFTVYNTVDGKPLNPDFVLFLTMEKPKVKHLFQIFILLSERKFSPGDKWKQVMLDDLDWSQEVKQNSSVTRISVRGIPIVMDHDSRSVLRKFLDNLIHDAAQ